MKAWILLSSSLWLSSAWAYPSLHDKATMKGSVIQAGVTIEIDLTREITEVIGDKYKVVSTIIMGKSDVTTEEEIFAKDELLSQETVKDILEQCTDYDGIAETVNSMATCKISGDDEDGHHETWLGDVPFGVVKATNLNLKDNYRTEILIDTFAFGK